MPERWGIGRGVGSGQDGSWRSVDINWGFMRCIVYLDDGTVCDWDDSPNIGVQVIVTHNGLGPTFVSGYDEYIVGGKSKYGTMIDWETYLEIDRMSRKQWQ